jgi:hypothetical protein
MGLLFTRERLKEAVAEGETACGRGEVTRWYPGGARA